ncbi:MAG: Na+/H+ antiporter NhaA [Pseudomonadota bacterium]
MNQTNRETAISRFLRLESAGGIILMMTALLAIIVANTSLVSYYDLLLEVPVEIKIGTFSIAKPLLLWINDGLMALFFFLVGLELKRELVEGELSEPSKLVLPAVGAVGGMAIPALIYVWFNYDDPVALKGWAIPAATDIAFALGVLALLGSRVPTSLKIFLTSLAIFDDIGAIVIIALFYTAKISNTALIIAFSCLPILYIMNRRGVESRSPYILIGVIMWASLLKSGVHATLAGVALAAFIPLKSTQANTPSPLKTLEHDLHSVVAFFVLPVFAFANAGISFNNVSLDVMLHSVPLGVALGLILGKQIGIFSLCWFAIKLGWTRLPTGMSWASLYGVSALCGIGFTMSLFIGSLAFEETGVNLLFDERLGIIVGSLISGLIGYLVLKLALSPNQNGGD